MRRLTASSFAILIAAFSIAAFSADPPQPRGAALSTPFDSDGYSAMTRLTQTDCLVGSDIDLKTMLEQVSDLQKRGLIRADVDEAHVKAHAWTTATAVAFKIEPMLVSIVYDSNPGIDHCTFVQTITGLDGKQLPAYGFGLTRALYKKTDWSKVGPADLPNVTDRFQAFKATADHLNQEGK
jgi:hypothetical protein